MFQNNDLFKMNLQLFGENEPQNPQTDTQTEPQTEPQQERMFTQAEMDAAIANRLSRYKRDEDKRIEEAKQAARSEAEKLAKMNAEQRAEHDRQEAERAAKAREEEITRREAELTRRELKATAMDELAKRKLPGGLLDILNYSDADACSASIATVEKAWRECVQQGVNERLAQSGVSLKTGGSPDYANMSDADYYAATYKPGGNK
ncbi:MAG: DUF4355 domain-containing protein [Candidatus Faecivicinus sp.]|nr:DUF4355 domain-containing protein [Candidatus Faecivicinus sp.]